MTKAKQEVQIGARMPDGTVFAGSRDGNAIFTTPTDAPLAYTFNEAADYAAVLNREKSLGHDDWRVPNKGELNVLWENRAAIGGFNAGWYWSSTPDDGYNLLACEQRFSDGRQESYFKYYASSLRCVRG
jgi:hypothetical protein